MRRLRRVRHRVGKSTEAGVTLVELIVYMSILVIILVIVGGLLVNSLTAQRNVRAVTQATTTAQLVTQSVERGVRNAAGVGYATVSGGEMLAVRTRVADGSTSSWKCQGWFLDAAHGGALYTVMRDASGGTDPVLVAPTTAGDLAGWTLLANAIAPEMVGGSVFQLSGGGQTVVLHFSAGADARKPVAMSSQVTSRWQGETGVDPCF